MESLISDSQKGRQMRSCKTICEIHKRIYANIDDDSRPLIGWTIDDLDWAFGQSFKRISQRLPQYRHEAFVMDLKGDPGVAQRIQACDIVVCLYPDWLKMFGNELGNVVAALKSVRSFE